MISWSQATDVVLESLDAVRKKQKIAVKLDYLESQGLWDTDTIRHLAGLYRSRLTPVREPALALVHMMHMIHSAKVTASQERAYGAREWILRNRVMSYQSLKSLVHHPFQPNKRHLELLIKLAAFYSVHVEIFRGHVAVLFEGSRNVMITDDGLYYPPSGRSTAIGVLAESGKPLAMSEYLTNWMTQRYKRQDWEEDAGL